MKSKFENNIKQSLENFESPYNAAAWENMRAKLDKKMPTSGRSSNWKWYGAASIAAVAIVASYFIFSGDKPTEGKLLSNTEVTDNIELTDDNVPATEENQTTYKENAVGNEDPIQETIAPEQQNDIDNVDELPTIALNNERVEQGAPLMENKGNVLMNTEENEASEVNTTEKPVILQEIQSVCAGEIIFIDNVNNVPLIINGPELEFMIPANESRKVRTKAGGTHILSALNDNSESVEFVVKDAPDAEFIMEYDNKYENGIPTTKIEATVPGTEFKWSYGNQVEYGRESTAHFYEKGTHSIHLTVTGSNGCTNTVSKTINIDNDYNLLAPNAINPNSDKPENRIFMPVALVERNAPFTMIVVDPKDGHTIFETRDASNAWDGIDSQTGQPVPFGSYIWKVILDQKAKGEKKNEYIGEIVVVDSNK